MSSKIRQRTAPSKSKGPSISHQGSMSSSNNTDEQQPLLPSQANHSTSSHTQHHHNLPSPTTTLGDSTPEMENLSRKSQWIVLAIASGACAAFNGVFAKLTTTELTTSFATWVAKTIGLEKIEGGVEVVVRTIFFLLNLLFNAIMWTLFTKALARGTSTTQVSILNTSSNFMITALLGAMIFSESLPPLWFVGAALLVAGNVIIGRREEGEAKDDGNIGDERTRTSVDSLGRTRGSSEGGREESDALLVGGLGEVVDLTDLEESRKAHEEGDILQLDSEDAEEMRNDLQLL